MSYQDQSDSDTMSGGGDVEMSEVDQNVSPAEDAGEPESIFTQRSPSAATYAAFVQHLSFPENEMTLHHQIKQLILLNHENLTHHDPLRGKALDAQAVRLIFFFCDRFKLPDVVKLTAVEIYDKWVLVYHTDINGSNLLPRDLDERGRRLKKDVLLRVCSCIQLAAKSVGLKNVSNEYVRSELRLMGLSVTIKKLISSEMRVFRGLGYNVMCMTPLDPIELLLMCLNMNSAEFRLLYGLCAHLIDYVYFFKNTIYTTLRFHLLQLPGFLKTEEELLRCEYDYILRGAAIIQCAMYIIRPNDPRSILVLLHRHTELASDEVVLLAMCIASSIFGE